MQRLEKADYIKHTLNKEDLARTTNSTLAQIEELLLKLEEERIAQKEVIYINDIYQVAKRDMGDIWCLSIKRRDKEVIHDWRDLQEIKNQLCGEECEGAELYPAESRLMDTANQYWLWVFKDPTFRIPLGFHINRTVIDSPVGGTKQRPRT